MWVVAETPAWPPMVASELRKAISSGFLRGQENLNDLLGIVRLSVVWLLYQPGRGGDRSV